MALNTVQMGTTVNSTLDFTLQRNTQAIKINIDGYYKLEVWGAGGAGGGPERVGGNGGYACGYKLLTNGTTIYVCVGAKGYFGDCTGYNGGSTDHGPNYGSWGNHGESGGCTHFATRDGTLASIGASNKSSVLIVAGGGGGGSTGWQASGGNGGGNEGGNGAHFSSGWNNAGTQTTGHAFGQGQNHSLNSDGAGGAGGGGWYGGYNGYRDGGTQNNAGGGGGSGYVGGVPSITFNGVTYSPTNTQGGYANSGGNQMSHAKLDGKAKITLVALTKIPVYFKTASTSNTQLTNLYFNNTKCDHCYFNNTKVY